MYFIDSKVCVSEAFVHFVTLEILIPDMDATTF